MDDEFGVQVQNILEEIPKSSRPRRFARQICREILNEKSLISHWGWRKYLGWRERKLRGS